MEPPAGRSALLRSRAPQTTALFPVQTFHSDWFLVRDPFGIKPLHYTRGSMGTCLFASELGALLCDKSIDRSVDPVALDGYLRSLTVPEPHCIIRSVHKVPAGHFVRSTREGNETLRYFELEIGSDRIMQQEELADQLRDALNETVRISLRGDTEVGCFLSGGVDSSALVATASQIVDGERINDISTREFVAINHDAER